MNRVFFFIFISVAVYGQPEYSRISLQPSLGIGMNLPGSQIANSGREWMTYMWNFYDIGTSIDARGVSSTNVNFTKKLGLDILYKLSNKLEIMAGAKRINLISTYKPSLDYDFQGVRINGVNDNFVFYALNFGGKFHANSLYYTASVNYYPNIFAERKRKNDSRPAGFDYGSFINENGTGIRSEISRLNEIKYGFYLGIGQEVYLMDSPVDLEIGFNFSPEFLYQEKVIFQENRAIIGENLVNRNINSIFISLHKTLNFKKKKKVVKEKVLKAKKEKPEKIKDKKTPLVKEKIDVGQRKIEIGENLVLNDIQFEQTKATLDAAGMMELDEVFEMLRKFPDSRIAITGHTSSEGSRSGNIELSRQRAEACKSYLVKKGIKANRINAYGLGPDRPVSDTDQELNRRVELKVISL